MGKNIFTFHAESLTRSRHSEAERTEIFLGSNKMEVRLHRTLPGSLWETGGGRERVPLKKRGEGLSQ